MCYFNGRKIVVPDFVRLRDMEKQLTIDVGTQMVMSGFDYGQWPVVRATADHTDFEVVNMEWGFLPAYVKTKEEAERFRKGYKDEAGKFHTPVLTLNAIGEELLLPRKMFREAALQRRCLVRSWGFFEWQHVYPQGRNGKPLKTPVKIPHHISLKGAESFFMAGVWQPWKDVETGEYIETFAIVTTAANELMSQIHNSKKRMPVILTQALAEEWIFCDLDEERITTIATFQMPAEQMQAHSVRKDFLSAPDPTEAFSYEELQTSLF